MEPKFKYEIHVLHVYFFTFPEATQFLMCLHLDSDYDTQCQMWNVLHNKTILDLEAL